MSTQTKSPESWRWPFATDTRQTQQARAPKETWWFDPDFCTRAKKEALRMNVQTVVTPKEPD